MRFKRQMFANKTFTKLLVQESNTTCYADRLVGVAWVSRTRFHLVHFRQQLNKHIGRRFFLLVVSDENAKANQENDDENEEEEAGQDGGVQELRMHRAELWCVYQVQGEDCRGRQSHR